MTNDQDTHYRVLMVFIASPSDLNDERQRFKVTIERANRIKAHQMGIHLAPLGWEDTLPGKGRPQSLINQDVERCDLFVLLLWKRWGSPSGEYSSGTEEEFELAKRCSETSGGKPYMLLYFKSVPEAMRADPEQQLEQVISFKTRIKQARSFLYTTFASPEDWEKKFLDHLCGWLDKQPPVDHPKSGEPGFTVSDVVEHFQKIPDLKVEDIREQAIFIHGELRRIGIVTRKQLGELVSSIVVLDTLRDIYIEELLRSKEAPLDPSAVATWGGILFVHGVSDQTVAAVRRRIRQSYEYKEKRAKRFSESIDEVSRLYERDDLKPDSVKEFGEPPSIEEFLKDMDI